MSKDASTPPPIGSLSAKAKHHLARYAAKMIHDAPYTPESIEAVIWTVSEYAYQVLKVDRRLHLASHMRHAARGESSLQMMRVLPRPFLSYARSVFSRPSAAPSKCLDKEKGLIRAFSPKKKSFGQWYLASLLHDIGYAVDVAKALKNWLEFFSSESFSNLANGIDGALEGMSHSEEFTRFCANDAFPLDQKPWEDHGMVGAHHLHTLTRDLRGTNNGKSEPKPLAVGEAVAAIAKHNCDKIPHRITTTNHSQRFSHSATRYRRGDAPIFVTSPWAPPGCCRCSWVTSLERST